MNQIWKFLNSWFPLFSLYFTNCGATDYLLTVMSSYDGDYYSYKEVGECPAAGARFGMRISGSQSLSGCFVIASPASACDALAPAPAPMENVSSLCTGYYAVVSRENCTFAEKAYHVQTANYEGLIVYNELGYNYPIEMGSDAQFGPLVKIAAFMVGHDCGTAIIRSFTYEKGFTFTVRAYWSYHDLFRYMIPFVVVLGICFSIMLTAMFIKCVRDRRRETRRRLTKKHLKRIPIRKYIKGQGPETCPICLDDFEENEKLRVLPCGHAYHCRCIDPWLLKTRRVCPICKRKVLADEDDSSDSEIDGRNESERTPFLTNQRRMIGNSTFYGVSDHGDAIRPPQPIVLTPASTPDSDNQRIRVINESQRLPLLLISVPQDGAVPLDDVLVPRDGAVPLDQVLVPRDGTVPLDQVLVPGPARLNMDTVPTPNGATDGPFANQSTGGRVNLTFLNDSNSEHKISIA